MRLALLGVRGSTPAPGAAFTRTGGNTSCVALADDGAPPSLVLDAGTGLRRLSGRLGGAPFRGTILLTHLHWDHVQGLPFFAAGDRDDAEVRLVMPAQGDPREVLGRALSPPHFPIGPDGLHGTWHFEAWDAGRHRAEGFEVLALDIAHKGGRTFGYRIEHDGASVAYLPDHLLVDALSGDALSGDVLSGDSAASSGGPDRPDRARENALTLTRHVDVLIHDAQFTNAERAVAEDYGHATVEAALALAEEAGARRLVLFHHGPDRTDTQLDRLLASVMGFTSVPDRNAATPAPAGPRRSGRLVVEIGTEQRVLDLPDPPGGTPQVGETASQSGGTASHSGGTASQSGGTASQSGGTASQSGGTASRGGGATAGFDHASSLGKTRIP